MPRIEDLLEDHGELRRLTADLISLVGEDERLNLDYLGPEVVKRLSGLERQLSQRLKAHEEAEDRLVAGLMGAADCGREPVMVAIRSDHASIRQVFQVLNALTAMAEAESAYSIRFAVWSLGDHLERHLKWEEAEAFPVLRRMMQGEALEVPAGS